MIEADVSLDQKGRLLLPKKIREKTRATEFLLISDRFGMRIVPKLSLEELRGISPIRVGTKNVRDERDRSI